MVLKVPQGYLAEYSQVFDESFGIKLSVSRISQILKQNGISHVRVCVRKDLANLKLQKEARERNQQLRDHWDSKPGRDFTQEFEFFQSVATNCTIGVGHIERPGQRRQFDSRLLCSFGYPLNQLG